MIRRYARYATALGLLLALAPERSAHADGSETVCNCEDPKMKAEHQALIDLFPVADATSTAVTSGDWSAPTTWGGTVPAAGARVFVPNGLAVRYDVDSTVALGWVRVEGTLAFAVDRSTRLRVGTLVSMSKGLITIGTSDTPLPRQYNAIVEFVDDGPITRAADPKKLSRGLVARGATTIHGARVHPWALLQSNAAAGATAITLARTTPGWQVGDRILIGATRVPERVWNGTAMVWVGTQDEVRTISAISTTSGQTTVTLDQPLQYAHTSPDIATYRPIVAHLTRNIRFQNVEGTTPETQRRGHVMFMHAPSVHVAWASFSELGRTDKSRWVDDPGTDPIRAKYPDKASLPGDPGSWDADTDEGSNPRGRYPLHIHRTGAEDPLGTPALVRGVVVEGSPGWGIATHDSHAEIEDSITYRVFGAGFVAEIGNELGSFRRNVAFAGEGDTTRYFKEGTYNHDLAFNGQGFWFQGRNVVVEDNYAVSQNTSGFFWFHRSYIEMVTLPLLAMRFHDQDAMSQRIVDSDGNRRVVNDHVPIRGFRNNTAIACETALEVVKANPHQEHDQRSMFFGVIGWNVVAGTNIEYTSFYTFPGLRIVRDALSRGGADGESPTNQWAPHGIHFHNNTSDMVLLDPQVTGWRTELRLTAPDNTGNTDGWFERTRIDVVGGNLPMADGHLIVTASVGENGVLTSSYHPDFHHYYPSLGTNVATTFVPAIDQDFVMHQTSVLDLDWTPEGSFTLSGNKTDSVGTIAMSYTWSGYEIRRRIEEDGTYEKDGKRVLPIFHRLFDRATNATTFYAFTLDVTSLYQAGTHPDRGALPADLSTLRTNRAPVATADSYIVPVDRESHVDVASGVLANDTDPDGDTLYAELSLTTQPSHGTVTLSPNGSFWYVPEPGYAGSDSFTYVLNDGTFEASPTVVVLDVSASASPDMGVVPGAPPDLAGSANDAGTSSNDGAIGASDGGDPRTKSAGCGCHTTPETSGILTGLLVILFVAVRRRFFA